MLEISTKISEIKKQALIYAKRFLEGAELIFSAKITLAFCVKEDYQT